MRRISVHTAAGTGMTERRGRRSSSKPASFGLVRISANRAGFGSGRTGSRSTTTRRGSSFFGSAYGARATRAMPTAAFSAPE